MRRGTGAAGRALFSRPRRRWLRHLLLAMSLVVVVLSIVGMHQLSVGHDVATRPTASSSLAESGHHTASGEMLPVAAPEHDHASGTTDGDPGGVCPDCVDHHMALGACLLALTLLVLRWLLAPPRPRRVPTSLLPRLAQALVWSDVGRPVPPLSLAELSLLRT